MAKQKTILQLIEDLTWHNLVEKLKAILRRMFPYKNYIAQLTQENTDDPTALVLSNNLVKTPVLTREEMGVYRLTSEDFADPTKVVVSLKGVNVLFPGDTPDSEFIWYTKGEGYVEIQTTAFHWSEPETQFWVNLDGRLDNTEIEIKVFN